MGDGGDADGIGITFGRKNGSCCHACADGSGRVWSPARNGRRWMPNITAYKSPGVVAFSWFDRMGDGTITSSFLPWCTFSSELHQELPLR